MRKRHNGDTTINSLPIQVGLEAAEPKCCRVVVNRAPSRTKIASLPRYTLFVVEEDPRK